MEWDKVLNRPSVFPPSTHGHTEYAPSGHGLGVALSSLVLSSASSGKALQTGMYYLSSSASDKPTGITDCALFVMAYSTAWITQLALDWRTNKTYTRVCTNGVWSSWIELGGIKVITSATEPAGLIKGDQWHKEI